MRLPELNLSKIEEFKNFSLEESLGKDYDLPSRNPTSIDCEVKDKFHGFAVINIVDGVLDMGSLPVGVNAEEDIFEPFDSFSPFLGLNGEYNRTQYSLNFSVDLNLPVVIVNNFTQSSTFITSNIKFKASDLGSVNLLETAVFHKETRGQYINSVRVFDIKNSKFNYARVDGNPNDTSHNYSYVGSVDGGELTSVVMNNSGFHSVNSWEIDLKSPDTLCNTFGVIKLSENMRHGSICKINHVAQKSESHQEFRHILDGSSYAMYDGDSRVVDYAKNSVTSQKSNSIMLSNNARILNKPRLNIFTGEVKATHGASVGKLDSEDIFYLKQRGLKDDIIKRLLVDAFVLDVLDRVESEEIRRYLYDKR